jgi:hypothetical protein
MIYFATIKTLAELKTEYKKLVLENHPDKGGNNVTMRDIIAEYKEVIKNGIVPDAVKIRYEPITVEDVEDYSDYVADIIDYEMDY